MLLGRRAFNIAQAMTDFIEFSGIVAVVVDDDDYFLFVFTLFRDQKNQLCECADSCAHVGSFVLKEARVRHQASSVSLCPFFFFLP